MIEQTKSKVMATRLFAFALALLACVVVLSSCSVPTMKSEEQKAAEANRTYMSEMNKKMETLQEQCATFSAAITAQDTASAKTISTSINASINEIVAMEAPEAMKDIHSAYAAGCDNLRNALNAYAELAANAASLSSSDYAVRMDAIQQQYTQGIEKLKEGDKLASEKK